MRKRIETSRGSKSAHKSVLIGKHYYIILQLDKIKKTGRVNSVDLEIDIRGNRDKPVYVFCNGNIVGTGDFIYTPEMTIMERHNVRMNLRRLDESDSVKSKQGHGRLVKLKFSTDLEDEGIEIKGGKNLTSQLKQGATKLGRGYVMRKQKNTVPRDIQRNYELHDLLAKKKGYKSFENMRIKNSSDAKILTETINEMSRDQQVSMTEYLTKENE